MRSGDAMNRVSTCGRVPSRTGYVSAVSVINSETQRPPGHSLLQAMTELFQNKYRIPSARAEWWDYGNNAAYFITICTQNREHFFGRIVANPSSHLVPGTGYGVVPETRLIASLHADGFPQLIPSPLGTIALACWLEIPQHFPFVRLDAFVVMPNHVHGILVIDKPPVETRFIASPDLIASLPPPVTVAAPPPENPGGFAGDKNPMLNDNLSRIIRWYKGRTSHEARKVRAGFAWQSRYHDHIIRSARAYRHISSYILNNPARWQDDRFFSTPDLSR